MDERKSSLSTTQMGVLEKRIWDAGRVAVSSPSRIPRRADPAAPVPLSSGQQRLWILDQLVPDNCSYNITRTTRIEGPLRTDVLGRAFGEVVARHESLRTTILSRDGRPVQIVAPFSGVAFPIVPLDHVPEA